MHEHETVESLLFDRNQAQIEGDNAKAAQILAQINNLGFRVDDSSMGQIWWKDKPMLKNQQK